MKPVVSLVVARAVNGVIGNRGAIPWRLPEDLRHFKTITLGKPCIMGRKTWESLPKRPLAGRANIVVTRAVDYIAPGAAVTHTVSEALARAEEGAPAEIAVIGGAGIYSAALPHATRVHLTEIHAEAEGEVSIPPFDLREWRETARTDHEGASTSALSYSFVTLERW